MTILICCLKCLHHRRDRKPVVGLEQILKLDAVLSGLSLNPHKRRSTPADPRGVACKDRTDILTLGFQTALVFHRDDLSAGIVNPFFDWGKKRVGLRIAGQTVIRVVDGDKTNPS